MLTLNNVSFRYNKHSWWALSHVSCNIGPGIHLLLGANGAGKTTLLNICAGVDFATEGQCLLDGADVTLRMPTRLQRVSMMWTGMQMPAATIRSMVRRHAVFFPHFNSEMLAANLEAFKIRDTDRLSRMSLGTANKAALAYTLALQTDVVLLDEPTNGLDIDACISLQQMVAQCVRPDACVIVSTHTVEHLQNLYDGVMFLNKGKLECALTLDELLQRITFVKGATAAADALGWRNEAGQVVSIVPADSPSTTILAETEPDYILLYLALGDTRNAALKNILSPSEPATLS